MKYEEEEMGERLANLAGYPLKGQAWGVTDDQEKLSERNIRNISEKESARQIKFNNWVRKRIYDPAQQTDKYLSDELQKVSEAQKEIFRKWKGGQDKMHIFEVIMDQLDVQVLPENCHLNHASNACSCKKCRDGMERKVKCEQTKCAKCRIRM